MAPKSIFFAIVHCMVVLTFCTSIAQTNSKCDEITPRIAFYGCNTTCAGGSIILDAGEGYTDYLWNDGSKTQKIIINAPEASGNYHCLVQTNGGCKVATPVVMVTIHAPADKPYIIRKGNKLVATQAVMYRWFLNNKPIPNGNNKDVVCTVTGDYRVVITNENGCSATSESISINELEQQQTSRSKDARLRVYPNPSDGRIAIQLLSDFDGDIDYSISDENGRIVLGAKWYSPKVFDIIELDITNQTDGVYFLTALDGVDVVTEKIVKVK